MAALGALLIGCVEPTAGLHGTVVTRHDGSRVSGELVHVFDMTNAVDHPRDEQFYALFDPRRFSPDPAEDRAFVLVSSHDIANVETMPLDPAIETYDAFVRSQGLVLDRLPLDGVWSVHEDGSTYHRDEGGCGDFAWDFNVVDEQGYEHCHGTEDGCTQGAHNHDYYAWQQLVRAPTAGRVEFAYGHHLDHPPGTFPDEAANGVALAATGAFTVGLFHFAHESVEVSTGTTVSVGDRLGRVGNSGYSWAPHLHASLYWSGVGAPRGLCYGWSVPTVFRELHVGQRGASAREDWVDPVRGQLVSNDAF